MQSEMPQRSLWSLDRLDFGYRTSAIKRQINQAVVLAARLKLARSAKDIVQARMDEHLAYRRRTQPPGASMGSMFKNPPGEYAGRLVEAAGLKGFQIGRAQISPLHGNFFINTGSACAQDLYRLLMYARRSVAEQFGIEMELEIELKGEWELE
jgi:UDP-N-acetylmuramate dehydrogenase